MPSFRHDTGAPEECQETGEARNIGQLGLDFTGSGRYSNFLRKDCAMNHELFETLDSRVSDLLKKFASLKEDNARLAEENRQLQDERDSIRSRVDAILGKLEGL